jgi:hypothetical protein
MPTVKVIWDNRLGLMGRRVRTIYGAMFPTVEGMVVSQRLTGSGVELYVKFDHEYEGMEGQWVSQFYENAHSEIGHHLLPDVWGEEEEAFGDFVEEAESIMKAIGMAYDPSEWTDDLQEFADAEEAGQTPREMAVDWICNYDTYRANYEEEAV